MNPVENFRETGSMLQNLKAETRLQWEEEEEIKAMDVVVEWLALLLCIREVLDSSLGPS